MNGMNVTDEEKKIHCRRKQKYVIKHFMKIGFNIFSFLEKNKVKNLMGKVSMLNLFWFTY